MSVPDLMQSWRREIVCKLENRKKREAIPYQELITSHGKLLSITAVSKLRISELELQTYKLKQEILDLQSRVALGDSSGSISPTSEKNLEQKIYKLQEELTELHRTKGEHAQKIIQITNELKQKEELLSQKESQISDGLNNIEAMTVETKRLHCVIVDLETVNQTLKDEHQALQLAYNSTAQKLKETQEENQQLIDRYLIEKAKVADIVNAANDNDKRIKEQLLQRQLQDAANEPINPEPKFYYGQIDRMSLPPSSIVCVLHVPDRPIQTLECHDGEVTSVRFSATGKYFVTGGSDKKVKIWEVDRGSCSEIGTLTGATASIMCVRFDMTEKLILASSNDNACRIWGMHDHRLRHALTGHTGKVLSAKFLGTDSSKIASGSHDRTLKIWDLKSKVCTKTIFAGSSCNDLVTADIAGTTIISGHFDKKIRFWDVRCEQVSNEIQLQGKVTSLDLGQDLQYLLACSRDDTLKIIDLRKNQIVSTYKTEGFKVPYDYARACFSPDSQYVVCGSYDGSLYVWNTKTNRLENVLKEHKNSVIATAWHPNGTCMLSCDRNRQMVLWTDV